LEDIKNNGNSKGSSNGHQYTFDGFQLDQANRLLEREGVAIPMPGKVFDVLVVFTENPGRLLEKEELIEKVWQQEFVEEGNLARHVSTLRKLLGDNGKDRKYIVTVQGRGYRFVADVTAVETDVQEAVTPHAESTVVTPHSRLSKKWLWSLPAIALVLATAWFVKGRYFSSPNQQLNSLAVLPLKSFDQNDNYIGVGIADAVIRRISQTEQLTVRPTSAVLKYLKEETDSLTAARELKTDAVLEGNVQRANDRLRVSVNLLRTSDGSSLWTDNFDLPSTDIFVMEDQVAQAVATRLQLRFDSAQSLATSKYPTSPIAYEHYLKGVFSLDERGYGVQALPQMNATIGFLQKAIDVEPNYALAHAQLAFAYAWTALFIDSANPKWADLAREEIKKSQEMGPQLAETHLANGLMLWSGYGGYQNDAALRELLIAKRLNPNTNHGELVGVLGHVGLGDQAERELKRELEIDPTSLTLKDLEMILPYLRYDADSWYVEHQKLDPTGPLPTWYLIRKSRWDDAQKVLEERIARDFSKDDRLMEQALMFAVKGDFHRAEKDVPTILARIPLNDQSRHHKTYEAACIYALDGKAAEAVNWLIETAATGFPNYPLFEHDPYLDHIRKSPEFNQFLSDEKTRWEKYRQEFGD
jgi:DNA-binding winged helix-turn-helix (wHTH) protein/TolB-like protein